VTLSDLYSTESLKGRGVAVDDRYGYATLQLISPETRTEPRIVPCGVYFHTHGTAGTSEAVGNWFGRADVNVEAHASIAADGEFFQFQFLDRQADAQMAANGWSSGGVFYGGISVESEDWGDPSTPWTPEQMFSGAMFLVHMHLTYGTELRLMTAPRQNAVGYHAQFRENAGGHHCPGPVRVAQLPEMIGIAQYLLDLYRHQQAPTDVVDELDVQSGHWLLQRDGGVITVRGDFLGSYPGLGPAAAQGGVRRFGWFEAREDGGYNIIANDPYPSGERYQFPALRPAT
jgi:hypothetical protein